jgi:integrase
VAKRFLYVSSYKSRHGKRYYRFRRTGYATYTFKEPYGTKAFEREYAACLAKEAPPVGRERTVPGSVGAVIVCFYSDNSFTSLRPSTQAVYRGVLENFRAAFGKDPMRAFDAARIAKLMNAMAHKPHAAARLRKLLVHLMRIARREKIVPYDFDPVKDAPAPKAESAGFHRWTEDELAAFEAAHALGTKPRLAFALLLWGAQRSGDVRMMTSASVAGGRLRLGQSKTANEVDIPVMPELREALEAGPTGRAYLIETKGQEAFTAKGFYNFFKRACVDAGLPHCAAHGLRKSAARRCYLAGCSEEEGMQITGHTTMKEYRRYAGITNAKPEVADAAMAKVANHRARVRQEHSGNPQKTAVEGA